MAADPRPPLHPARPARRVGAGTDGAAATSERTAPVMPPGVTYVCHVAPATGTDSPHHLGRDHLGPVLVPAAPDLGVRPDDRRRGGRHGHQDPLPVPAARAPRGDRRLARRPGGDRRRRPRARRAGTSEPAVAPGRGGGRHRGRGGRGCWPSGRSPDGPASSGCRSSSAGCRPACAGRRVPGRPRTDAGPRPEVPGHGGGPVTVHDGGAHRHTVSTVSVFDGLRICSSTDDGRSEGAGGLGVVVDDRARTVTAVLAVRGHSFALLGPAEQDARVAAWARVLAVARPGGLGRAPPAVGGDVPARRRASGARPPRRPRRAGAGIAGRPVLPVAARRVGAGHPAPPGAGGGHGPPGSLGTGRPGCRRGDWPAPWCVLGPRGGGGAPVPGGGGHRRRRGPRAGGLAGVLAEALGTAAPAAGAGRPGTGRPWPMGTEARWEAVRTDGAWHAVYWVSEWPRVDVRPDFLGPLLFAPLRRTLSVVMEPVDPTRAARQVAQARTAGMADGELRRRNGFLSSARHAREHAERRRPGRGAGRRPCPVPVQRATSGSRPTAAPSSRRRAPPSSRPPARRASRSAASTASRTPPSCASCPLGRGLT